MIRKIGMKKIKKKEEQSYDSSGEFPAYHTPVLLNEVIGNLKIHADGVYVDCTFGGGGHSRAILQKLNNRGRLVAFDQDPDAQRNLPDDGRMLFIPQNFRYLQRFLRLNGIDKVDGILADLGVSSHQFDEPSRGFSTRFEADLDMRMDQRQQKTALEVLKTSTESQLHKLFEQYGEVTNSKTLARTIVEERKTSPLKSIEDFKNLIRPVVKGNPKKYLAQVFQALRIEVNEEMDALKEMLVQVPQVLNEGGRIAVISFHSIEDRIVKQFFRDNTFDPPDDNPFLSQERILLLKPVNKKPVEATKEEVRLNPRSRSAKLRVAERTL